MRLSWRSVGACPSLGFAAKCAPALQLENRFPICSSGATCDSSMGLLLSTLGFRGTGKGERQMPDSKCRRCQQEIVWHKSKTGKAYPCNSDNRRDFHQCNETPPLARTLAPLQPQTVAPHSAPLVFEATLEERVHSLETRLTQIAKLVRELQAAQPITDRDIPF
jgi:hypothetical protein